MTEGAGSTERESLKALVEELERECPEPTVEELEGLLHALGADTEPAANDAEILAGLVEELERSAAAGPGPGSGKGSPPVAAPGPS